MIEPKMAAYQQQLQAVASKKSAIDEAVNIIHDEVIRYSRNLSLLISKLEAPRPINEEGCNKIAPTTIGEALGDIYSILCNNNESLQHTIKRIEEQVGELKLLP